MAARMRAAWVMDGITTYHDWRSCLMRCHPALATFDAR